MSEDWREALDKKHDVAVAALDLSKAFYTICHNLLLAKLKAYGLDDSSLGLARSYLRDRKQRVSCNGVYSDWLPIQCGVPHGSVLGPLIFDIFINDINLFVKSASLCIYADDTTEYAQNENPALLQLAVNEDTANLSRWFQENFMRMNYTKTKAMIMGNSNFDYSLKVNDVPILGVSLDRNLCFEPHIKTVLQKVYCKVGALRRIRKFIPTDICIRLYKAFILPHLAYCSPIHLGINKSLKTKLEAANH